MAEDLIQSFDKDSLIFRHNDPPGDMYIIHSGRIRLLRPFDIAYETLAILERGDFFGEMSVLENLPRNATAVALEDDTKLISLNEERFEKMLQDNIDIALRMIRNYSAKLRAANGRLEKIIRDKQELDSGIQDILSHVRKRSDEDEGRRWLFGWIEHLDTDFKFNLKRPEVLVGRKDPTLKQFPDVDLTKLDKTRTISRRHARISYIDGCAYVSEEPGVTNGTMVNGKQVPQSKLVPVLHNDKLQFGKIGFRLLLDLQQP